MSDKLGTQIEEMDYNFNSKVFNPSDVSNIRLSNSNVQDDKRIEIPKNSLPSTITGPSDYNYGDKINLSFTGGRLGKDAEWVWYRDKCEGDKLGEGANLSTVALDNTTIFLGISGGGNNVYCISKEIRVNKTSKLPSKIMSIETVCKGQSVKLWIEDGFLGPNSKWEWFEGNCNGKKVGEGVSIEVVPDNSKTYYVKASGSNPTQNCLEKVITVVTDKKNKMPKQVVVPENICKFEKITLNFENGELSKGSDWVWYFTEDGINKFKVGRGKKLEVYPKNTGFYVLSTEGVCGPSEAFVVSNKIIVHKNLSNTYLSHTPNRPKVDEKIIVKIENAPKKSKWLWSIDSDELKKNSTQIKFRTKESVFVTASEKGYCSEKKITKFILLKEKSSYKNSNKKTLTRWYSKNSFNNKTFHFGGSVGIFNNIKPYSLNIDQLASINLDRFIQTSGIAYQVSFHPIIKNKISYGLYFQNQIGLNTTSFLNKNKSDNYSNSNIKKLIIGNSLAFGANGFKLLYGYERKYEELSFNYTNNRLNVFGSEMYIQNIEDEMKFGFRLFPYTNKKWKKSTTLDLLFNLYHQNTIYNNEGRKGDNNFSKIFTNFNYTRSGFNYGCELNLWMQSSIGFNFRYINFGQTRFNSKNGYYQVGIIWNFDFFR